MGDLRKAAEMALEALETIKSSCREGRTAHAENEAAIVEFLLRQALAKPEQTVKMDEYKRLQELVTSQGVRLMEYESRPEQEPVAWINYNAATSEETINRDCHSELASIPLYTAPPKREWVGLTGLEQKELMAMNSRYAVFETEAKLKEKNG